MGLFGNQMEKLFNKKKKKVFLGGTCNESTWREKLIPMLKIDYFNPVVDNWTEDCYQKELEEKEIADYQLYVITPKMTGVFSIAEAVDASNKIPEKMIFCYLKNDDGKSFDQGQCKSLDKVKEMISKNGGTVCETLEEVASACNRF